MGNPDDRKKLFDSRSGGGAHGPRRPSGFNSDRGVEPDDTSSGFRGNRNENEFQASHYHQKHQPPSRGYDIEPPYIKGEPESPSNGGAAKKRSYDDYQQK